MQTILTPLNIFRSVFDSSNLSSTEKNSTVDSHVINLQERIESNRILLDGLKRDSGFQNTLTLMHKAGVPEEQLLKFLTGNASLEECLGKKTWMIAFLIGTYAGLEVKSRGLGRLDLHFLEHSLADTLTTIFKQGYSESGEKTHSKMNALMQAIEEKNNSGKLDLASTNLAFFHSLEYGGDEFKAAMAEFNLIGVRTETKAVMLAEREIDIAFSKIENGENFEAIEICEAVYKNAQGNCGRLENKIIEDKLFEAALEISLEGDPQTAASILSIPRRYGYLDSYNMTAMKVLDVLTNRRMSTVLSTYPRYMVKLLEEAIAGKVNLKYTPYFLGKVYENGLYGVQKNEAMAKEYLRIATEREFEPRSVRKQRESYIMMREAERSEKSVFFHIPTDIINRIAHLRLEATRVQSESDKKV
jgi:TPR repeat protein